MLLFLVACAQQPEDITIGAILPLSGPASIWGDDLKNSMDLAREDLAKEGKEITIIYEDSQANPAQGVAAFNKLVNINEVDVVVSSFSRVSIPLIPLAEQHETPLIATIVASKDFAAESPYAFRYYPTNEQYVLPHIERIKGDVAVLYINDEYGASVKEVILAHVENIVAIESFSPAETEFKTQLTKIQASSPDTLVFVGAVPQELLSALQQIEELNIDIAFVDASPLLGMILETAGETAEGARTIGFAFDFNKEETAFDTAYKEKHRRLPLPATVFGYDIVQVIARADRLTPEGITTLSTHAGVGGKVQIQQNGEINPLTVSAIVKEGKLEIS